MNVQARGEGMSALGLFLSSVTDPVKREENLWGGFAGFGEGPLWNRPSLDMSFTDGSQPVVVTDLKKGLRKVL